MKELKKLEELKGPRISGGVDTVGWGEWEVWHPVLAEVGRLAKRGRNAVVAIDGRCGSGKTGLARLLESLFLCWRSFSPAGCCIWMIFIFRFICVRKTGRRYREAIWILSDCGVRYCFRLGRGEGFCIAPIAVQGGRWEREYGWNRDR